MRATLRPLGGDDGLVAPRSRNIGGTSRRPPRAPRSRSLFRAKDACNVARWMVVPAQDPRRSHRSDDRHGRPGGWRPRASGRLSASSLPVIATPVPGAWITSRTNDALVRARNAASASRPSRPAADLPADLTRPPSGAGPPPWSTRSGHGPSPLGETLVTRIAAILGVRPARAIRSYACVFSRLVVHAYGGPRTVKPLSRPDAGRRRSGPRYLQGAGVG